MLSIDNKFYTWHELVKDFPDKWVVVENATLDDAGFIKEGELIGVCSDNEIDDFVVECYKCNRNISYQRTTDTGSVGIINVEGIEIQVE